MLPLTVPHVFITGTDTGIGKTRVATGLLRAAADLGITAIGMKPIATGYLDVPIDGVHLPEDVLLLQVASNTTAELALVNPYRFASPIAPHLAAAATGVSIDLLVIKHAFQQLQQRASAVIVEGAGGVCVPLSKDLDMLDIPKTLDLPVILVVGMRLGCINHALLSMMAIKARGLACLGWIANQIDPQMLCYQENRETLVEQLQEKFQAPLVAEIPYQSEPTVSSAAQHLYGVWQQLLS